MRDINTKEVKAKMEAKALLPKPKIKIEWKVITNSDSEFIESATPDLLIEKARQANSSQDLVSICWHDFNELKIERSKLSSQICRMVEGGATTAQLKELYNKIESYRPQLQELFDRARHVEQYGELPIVKKDDNGQSVDIASLKYEKKKLSEKRSKLQKKISLGTATAAPKLLEWQIELEQATAEYNNLDERIKKMEGKA